MDLAFGMCQINPLRLFVEGYQNMGAFGLVAFVVCAKLPLGLENASVNIKSGEN